MGIFKKTFRKKFYSSLKKENKEIEIKEIKGSFCFDLFCSKKKKREMLGLKAFLPSKEVRMIFIISHNYRNKKKRKINFIFCIGVIELNDIRYKEVCNNSFSMEILDEKELEDQLKSFLLYEKINSDYFINNKFKK